MLGIDLLAVPAAAYFLWVVHASAGAMTTVRRTACGPFRWTQVRVRCPKQFSGTC